MTAGTDARGLAGRSSATIFETGVAAMLPTAIRAVTREATVAGRALTVRLTPGQNIWLHRAIYEAEPGDILVASAMGAFDFGYWGDILTTAALQRGVGGLVIDGCVRDQREIETSGFPVFARGLCVRGTGKDPQGGGIGGSLPIGESTVVRGDWIAGDADGVVVVPAADVVAATVAAAKREAVEAEILDELRNGRTTIDLYGWTKS